MYLCLTSIIIHDIREKSIVKFIFFMNNLIFFVDFRFAVMYIDNRKGRVKMSASKSIKGLLLLTGKKQNELVQLLNMSSPQSLANKFKDGRWSAKDLAAISEFCGCKLAFLMTDGQQIYIENDNQ